MGRVPTRFDVPQFRPEAQLLAAAGIELVGLCQLSHHPDNSAIIAANRALGFTDAQTDWSP